MAASKSLPSPSARSAAATNERARRADEEARATSEPAPTSTRTTAREPKRAPRITRAGRIALVGRPNVGKSTLLNALLGEPIAITSRHPQTTRDRIVGIATAPLGRHTLAQCVFVDTPGLHKARTRLGARMNQEAREGARDADVVVFVTDVAPGMSPELRAVDRAILETLPKGKPVLLVLNKIDKIKAKHDLFPVLEGHGGGFPFAAVVPVSARKVDGAASVLGEVAKLLPEGPALFEGDELTDRPLRFFAAEFVREQILRRTHDEVPHGVAVVVERFEEARSARRSVTRIELAVHVDRESHKRIVIGAKGALLKEIGTDARARFERLLGQQVHLQIWVRVSPGWYEKDSMLRDLGYTPPTETTPRERVEREEHEPEPSVRRHGGDEPEEHLGQDDADDRATRSP